jgi:hypothetical protein
VLALFGFAYLFPDGRPVPQWVWLPIALVLTVAVALLRYRLWDIDPLINRTLLYAALTLCVVGAYTFLVGYLSFLFQSQATSAISLAATVVIAIGLQPLRGWLQRGVDWLPYGERNQPYRVFTRLGQRLEATLAPDAALRKLVETVQAALKLPYVAVALGRGASREIVAGRRCRRAGDQPAAAVPR